MATTDHTVIATGDEPTDTRIEYLDPREGWVFGWLVREQDGQFFCYLDDRGYRFVEGERYRLAEERNG